MTVILWSTILSLVFNFTVSIRIHKLCIIDQVAAGKIIF